MTSVADRLAQKTSRRTASKQVRLRLVHVDFWSWVKLAFLAALCLMIIGLVMTVVLWTVLVNTGVFESINRLFSEVGSNNDNVAPGEALPNVFDFGTLMMFSFIVGLLNLIVLPALAAVLAFLYNLSVKVTGGLVFGFTNG